jgi:hypothetical protein
MRCLASVSSRLFLACWLVYGLFFATNIVREHYPAFALIEQGNFQCDRYQDWHADIFRREDGHSYVGNNVFGSVIAAVPLLVFDPLLDRLEAHSRRKLAESPTPPDATYDTKHPNRADLFRRAKLAGLDLRFGASAAITSLFLMAPLSALFAVLVHRFLLARGIAKARALWLALLFAFGTPVFYRTAHLNHNVFLMQALFAAFLLLWVAPEEPYAPTAKRRAWAGFLLGCAIALDYAGVLPALILGAWFLLARRRSSDWPTALREAVPGVLAALPPIAFLLWSQWVMYGNPLTPGQFVMRPVNYTEVGLKGMTWPTLEVFLKNLVMPGWGLFTFGPLLLFALVPSRVWPEGGRILPRRERRLFAVLIWSFLLFCASNQYSMMQFNTGFRYLLPVVPFLFLQASETLARLSARTLAVVTALVLAHSLVLCMTREVNDTEKNLRDAAVAAGVGETELPGYWRTLLTETPIPMSYRRVASEGPQLPWLSVLVATRPQAPAWLKSPLLPTALILACGLAVWLLLRPRAGPEPTAEPAASS